MSSYTESNVTGEGLGVTAADAVPLAVSTTQNDADLFKFDKFDSRVREREFYLGPHDDSNDEELFSKISSYYDVEKLVQFLRENEDKFHNVTLQFPDSLILDSSIVSRLLQRSFPASEFHNHHDHRKLDKDSGSTSASDPSSAKPIRRFWILADTAYSACCVDEVAAEHVNAELVVHFGDACLNAIQKLPVVYSFGKPFLNIDLLIDKFTKDCVDPKSKICLMANAPYTYHIEEIYDRLTKEHGYENLVMGIINEEMAGENVTFLENKHQNTISNDKFKLLYTLGNRKIYGSRDHDSIPDESTLQENYQLFYITIPQDPHLLYLTTVFNSVSLYDNHSNAIVTGPFPSLMKRYKFMNVARTAGYIGILINTLSLRNTRETINKLIKLIKANGKKHYLFVVGKPNVAKLANFEPVDIWCILGCNQSGIIVDQFNDFFKPIITPYELTLALNKEITWTGKWVVDFENALKDIELNEDEESIEISKDERNQDDIDHPTSDSDAPEFDVVTGKYVSTSRPLRGLKHLEIESPEDESSSSKELTKSVRGGAIIKGTVSTSVSHLQSRQWTGLGSDFNEEDEKNAEEGASVEQGIFGVARGYQFDREDAKSKQ